MMLEEFTLTWRIVPNIVSDDSERYKILGYTPAINAELIIA